jgi:hypothetical protein
VIPDPPKRLFPHEPSHLRLQVSDMTGQYDPNPFGRHGDAEGAEVSMLAEFPRERYEVFA